MSVVAANPNLAFVNLEMAGRAILLAFFCDIPIALWGGPGIGKSSKVWQIATKLGMKVYDFRVSDKEKSDIGGIPYPLTVAEVKPYIEYLIAKGLLPFDTDERCLLFCDEADRTDDPGVKNAIQQIWLDRKCNGHVLSPNCRIVIAGNGTSDIDTSPLSKAANGRMIHLYIENESEGAQDSWQEWAAEIVPIDDTDPDAGEQTRASEMLRAFARANHKVWINGQGDTKTELAEQAEPTNRTWMYADTIIRAAERVSFKTHDIMRPLVAGCVGLKAATELLAYARDFGDIPTIDSVLADPEHALLPDRPDVFYMLTFSLTDAATRDRASAEAIATYGLRWGEEQAAFLFRRLLDKQPSVASTTPYQTWAHRRLKHTPSNQYPAYNHYEDQLVQIFPGSVARPENDGNVNRVEIPSKSNPSGKGHILSQGREDQFWRCSCPGWVNRRRCDHTKRVPEFMRQPNDPTYSS